MNTVESLRERLLAIDWTFRIDETRAETQARIALFREFLRRAAPYGTLSPGDPVPWPFFDVAARVDPTVRAPEDVLADVAAKVPQFPTTAVRNSCLFALHFAALHDAGQVPNSNQDPFAPLIYMYERGGSFARDGAGMIEIGIATIGFETQTDWLTKPVPPGLPDFPDLTGESGR